MNIPAEADEERVARRYEILALQRFRESIAKCLDDLGRISLISIIDCQGLATVASWLLDRRVRFADTEP